MEQRNPIINTLLLAFPDQVDVLSVRPAGGSTDRLEVLAEHRPDVSLRMEDAAEVFSRVSLVLGDHLAGLESLPLFRSEEGEVTRAVDGEKNVSSALQDPMELSHPPALKLFGQMGEDGDDVDEVESLVGKGEGRTFLIDLKLPGRKGGAAPLGQLGVEVRSFYPGPAKVMPVAKDASAAAAEVQNLFEVADLEGMLLENLANPVGQDLAPTMEVLQGEAAADEVNQLGRGKRHGGGRIEI